jgi:hypothetical protein
MVQQIEGAWEETDRHSLGDCSPFLKESEEEHQVQDPKEADYRGRLGRVPLVILIELMGEGMRVLDFNIDLRSTNFIFCIACLGIKEDQKRTELSPCSSSL